MLAMKAAVRAVQRTVARSRCATARQQHAATLTSSPRQVNAGGTPRNIAAATVGPVRRSVLSELPRRRMYIVAGASETLQLQRHRADVLHTTADNKRRADAS